MAFTVTANATNGQDNVVLKVWVVTGGIEAGGAVACALGSFSAGPHSITPNASGSVIVSAVNNDSGGNTAQTPGTNNTTDDSVNTTSAAGNSWDGHYSGTVTSGTPVSVGTTFGASGDYSYAIYEVKPSGTAAIDASTPAAALGTTAAATTASFTPPAGAVLVAIVTAVGSNTQVFSVSDTSGLGLTWTQRGTTATGGFTGSAAIYTTTISGGGAAAVMPVPAWERPWYPQLSRQFGPAEPFALRPLTQPAAVPPVVPSGSVPGGVVYRRRPARALVAGLVAAPIIAHAVTGGMVAQRAPQHRARAVTAHVTGQPPVTLGPAGSPPGGLVIRRQASGVTWGGLASSRVQAPLTPPAGSPPGGVVRRRAPARAVTAGRAVPPRIPVPVTGGLVRRRTVTRAVVAHITGKAFPNGSKPGGVVYRRRTARVVTSHAYGVAYPNGAKPGGVVAWRRPVASRGLWAHVYGQPPPVPPGPAGSQPGGLAVRRQPQQRPRITWKGLASPLVSGATLITLTDVAAATDLNAATVTAAVALPDTAGAVEWQYADGSRTDVAAAVDQITASAQTAVADVAAATDATVTTAAVSLGDVAGAADSVLSGEPTAPADVAAGVEALAAQVTAPEAEVAAAAEGLSVQKPATGPVATWDAHACQPRWQTQPAPATWAASPAGSRWSLQPALSLWSPHPASLRWRIIMAVFDPISALSAEDVNVTWTSSLDGTSVDPTQAPFTVQFAFPLSSGNQQRPAEPSTWYTGQWLAGGTGKGYVAQCPVGPGTTGPTLTAGQSYDVWSQVTGTNEQPVKYAGTLQVY